MASASILCSRISPSAGGDRREEKIDPPGRDIGDGLAGALERHLRRLETGAQAQPLGRQVAGAAGTERGVKQRIGFRLRLGHQVLERLEAAGRHDHDVGQIAERHHRAQIAQRVVGQRLVRIGRDRDARGGDQHGVAVGRCFRGRRDADDVRRARLVLGDDGLPDLPAYLLHHDARGDVEGAARRIGDDDVDRLFRRPLLRDGGARNYENGGNKRDHSQQ